MKNIFGEEINNPLPETPKPPPPQTEDPIKGLRAWILKQEWFKKGKELIEK